MRNPSVRPYRRVVYPASDGEPIAEHTYQFDWIATLQWGVALLFGNRPDVFVAADNFIYPVEGNPKVRTAPDLYVAFGRPKHHRDNYRVWDEADVFPQVVAEVPPPRDCTAELAAKLAFYDLYGAEEYYVWDVFTPAFAAYRRKRGGLVPVPAGELDGLISPRLGVRFEPHARPDPVVRRPDGEPLKTPAEYMAESNDRRDAAARRAAEDAARRDEANRLAADNVRLRALCLAAGIDPDRA